MYTFAVFKSVMLNPNTQPVWAHFISIIQQQESSSLL